MYRTQIILLAFATCLKLSNFDEERQCQQFFEAVVYFQIDFGPSKTLISEYYCGTSKNIFVKA